MEQQFILRLPDILLDVDPKECSLTRINQKEVSFCVKGKTYPGIICNIPSIVESQKIVENKLYKIADISTLVVIYENSDFIIEEELLRLESSGLSPSMAYVKEKRFEKNSVRSEEVEKIEKKVNELLQEDLRALKVEILTNEKESTETDLDLLAAEIENEFRPVINEKTSNIVPIANLNIKTTSENKPIIPDKNITKNSFNESNEFDDMPDVNEPPINKTEKIPELIIPVENLNVKQDIIDVPAEIVESVPVATVKSTDPELLVLEAKIKEKQEQFDKAANPILKKRFEMALNALNESYKAKLEESYKK